MQAAAGIRIATAPAPTGQAPGRAFLASALGERSASALAASFRAALAAEGVTRHFCARHHSDGTAELLACDYPFDPDAVAELGRMRFEIECAQGERLSVTIAGAGLRADADRRARLHGYAMLYATCLPALLDAGEPQAEGSALTAGECRLLERLLLGETEGGIAAADAEPVRSVEMRIRAACAKLGAAGAKGAIVVAAQRGFLNNRR